MEDSGRPIGCEEVLDNPHGAAQRLGAAGCIFGLSDIDVPLADLEMVVFWLTLEPWTAMVERGYPTERVSITIWLGGRITAVPIAAADRTWEHRYSYILGRVDALGELCLWFPDDPRSLRWTWEDGLAAYVTIVHRHLQAEEYFRRTKIWPGEAAPHGLGDHLIRTPAMHRIALEGAA